MRLLHWSQHYWPVVGGSEVLAMRLLPALVERGLEVEAVVSHEGGEAEREDLVGGVRVHRLPFLDALGRRDPGRVAALNRRVLDLWRRFEPDFVYLNSLGPLDLFHRRAQAALPTPYGVTVQQRWLPRLTEPGGVLNRTLGGAEWIACCSESTRQEVLAADPGLAGRVRVVRNALPAPDVAPAPLPWDPPVMLCHGRLLAFKGFDRAIEAFAGLGRDGARARLVTSGAGPEGAALEALADRLGARERVEFAGRVEPERVPALLNSASLVVLPSRWEGLPLVAIEAAQMGRPVLATRVGGMAEVVVHGETGLLVPSEDPGALREGMRWFLAHPEEARAMGERARRRAAEEFGWEAYVDAYEDLVRAHARARAHP